MQPLRFLAAWTLCLAGTASLAIEMPENGISAHRGDNVRCPENTLAAYREAIWQGAEQIELDVDMTSDGHLVIMHDATVDRTTNGSGAVTGLTLAQIKALDAGSWKAARFTGERVPTLAEALDIMPENVWVNVHMRGGYATSYATAMEIFSLGREHQAFMAVTASQWQARDAATAAGKTILLCNMEGQSISSSYVTATINGGFDFLQFLDDTGRLPAASDIARLRAAGVKMNYFGSSALGGAMTASPQQNARNMFAAGIDFPLVDNAMMGVAVAEECGYMPLVPEFRYGTSAASIGFNVIVNPGAEIWYDDYHHPTASALPSAAPLLTRDRELYGWRDVVEVTNEPYGAANLPSSSEFPQAQFGKNAFVGGYIDGTRWIEQTIDVAALAATVDAGSLEFALSGWFGGLAGQRDYTAFSAAFLDDDGKELDLARLSVLNADQWGGTTDMVRLATQGAVPVGTRSVDVRLWFNAQTGEFANGMADNLSLVFTQVGEEEAVPEPATTALLGMGALALLATNPGRYRRGIHRP